MNPDFKKELPKVVESYPNLTIKEHDGKDYLKGILDILNENGDVLGSFLIEIHSHEKFPYRFPKLYEVGREIPVHADWHKYSDNSCCLTVEPDEIIICKNGMSVSSFIKEIAVPYFANQLYRRAEGIFFNEYPHGTKGFRVFYNNLFKSEDVSFWLDCLKHTFKSKKSMRNENCYCDSGMKFKSCHLKVEEKLRVLGLNKVLKDIKNIIE